MRAHQSRQIRRDFHPARGRPLSDRRAVPGAQPNGDPVSRNDDAPSR